MAEAYRLYAGTQAGMILFRGVADIWTSMGGSRENRSVRPRLQYIRADRGSHGSGKVRAKVEM